MPTLSNNTKGLGLTAVPVASFPARETTIAAYFDRRRMDMNARERQRLDRMFYPRALAVYGAVHEPGEFGHMVLYRVLRAIRNAWSVRKGTGKGGLL